MVDTDNSGSSICQTNSRREKSPECDRATIELDREVAVEAGGELLGRRRRIDLAVARPVTFATVADR